MKATKHCNCYVCRYYNIDLLKVKTNNHYCKYFDEIVSQYFIPRITFPTQITEQLSTLIDNIYTNSIDERESSGILFNQISDHQMIFTLIENFTYVTQAPTFVEIEINDPESIQNFVNELDELNIYNHLQTAIDSSPDVNYHTILELLSTVKDNHLPKKIVKFNRKKHKKAKWMTNSRLKSINTKDKLYKKTYENGCRWKCSIYHFEERI